MKEGTELDKKSLNTVLGNKTDFYELAKDCVAFANTRGGMLHIGIEDDEDEPPIGQTIPPDLPDRITARISQLTINVATAASIQEAANGAQFILLNILPSLSSVACTSKGQYMIRDNDNSRPVMPEELTRLFTDKDAYCWETKTSLNIHWTNCDIDKLHQFVTDIKNSDRPSKFIKDKTEEELLTYYVMIDERGILTNLGVLWIGKPEQRARLLYSPIVQYIKYDEDERKVNKKIWSDYTSNPKELLEEIWQFIPDWKEHFEVSEGLWRKNIPAYDEKVVREVLCNAFVHRPYTMRGDIFINIYPNKMTITNPGRLPLGITPENILQKTQKRNDHLSKLFYDLHLMEAEGSGYDLMYETLLRAGKSVPTIEEGDDFVSVTIERAINNTECARLCEYVSSNYNHITQKSMIAFGIIAQEQPIPAVKLSKYLQLSSDERLTSYVSRLVETNILTTRGKGKGTVYAINPEVIANSKTNSKTTLRSLEPYALNALILEDLRLHPHSSIETMSKRLPGVDYERLQKVVRTMAIKGTIVAEGGRKYRTYRLP